MSKHTERIGVVVVGGGAAGLVAAIMAARNGAKVLILEHNEVPGKKILATGNGKCNYTNKVQGVDKYYGQNPAFVAPVFEQFGLEETLQFFKAVSYTHLDVYKRQAYTMLTVLSGILLMVISQKKYKIYGCIMTVALSFAVPSIFYYISSFEINYHQY